MISPYKIIDLINSTDKKYFNFKVLNLDTEIANITKFNRLKFIILYKDNKINSLEKIIPYLIVDINSFIIHDKRNKILPNFIYPIAFPLEIFDINKVKVKTIIKIMKKEYKTNYKMWKNVFNKMDKRKIN